MTSYPHLGAFESTKIHGSGRDILDTTHHWQRWEHDLGLLVDAGIRHVRYSAPWHRIERQPGEWDWQWMDGPMRFMQRHGMRPIMDPLHLCSFPDWLTNGFAHPLLPTVYERFIERFAERYPWVEEYTVFNEPLPSTVFSGLMGMWYPHRRSERDWVAMAVNAARTICRASHALLKRNPNIRLVHVDTGERHHALEPAAEEWVRFMNHRRFLIHDLVLGRVTTDHPLYSYLRKHNFREDDRLWLQDNAAPIHVLGLDYYWHSELGWRWDAKHRHAVLVLPTARPIGFAAVAREYQAHFHLPLLLSETNIRGTVGDRITWLKYMEEQCEQLVAEGVDFRGFCWYPSVDSTDWAHYCSKCTESLDPHGIWWLDKRRWDRHPSELSWWYSQLARGLATSRDLPAYIVQPPLDWQLKGFLPLMAHWPHWREQNVTAMAG